MKLSESIGKHWVFYKGRPRRLRVLIAQLEAELEKWRRWIPNDDTLRDMQEQARARDGTYTNGLAAQAVYIGGLESRQRQLEARIKALEAHVPKSVLRRLDAQIDE